MGTDSHTTMVNGLGVLGWGVGGIEAEAAMLGQPAYLAPPIVVGVRFHGALPAGSTATDLVLTLTEMLRKHGVVEKFVEFCGDGLSTLSVPDRATMSNMCPEYGATSALFPVDVQTLRYLEITGRSREQIDLVERYTKEQGLFRTGRRRRAPVQRAPGARPEQGRAQPRGPRAPAGPRAAAQGVGELQQRLRQRSEAKRRRDHAADRRRRRPINGRAATAVDARPAARLENGCVVIAAITSCTNTSNPSVMVAAGLLAKKAVERGLRSSRTSRRASPPARAS